MQGMSLAPSVTELLMAEFMYLQTESETQPIYFYINSAGVQVHALSTSHGILDACAAWLLQQAHQITTMTHPEQFVRCRGAVTSWATRAKPSPSTTSSATA